MCAAVWTTVIVAVNRDDHLHTFFYNVRSVHRESTMQ